VVGTAPAQAARSAPVREGDLAALQRLLDEVLRERGGEQLLAARARLHAAALEFRRGEQPSDGRDAVVEALGGVDGLLLARACAMQLAIENVADELRRKRERTTATPARANCGRRRLPAGSET